MTRPWRHVDAFSGIGGFALAAGWTGRIKTVQFIEIDPFCQQVLTKHWPGVPIQDDIKAYAPEGYDAGPIDLLTGGFPCQPFSVASKQRAADDHRYLWPELARVVSTLRPRWLLLENVAGIVNLAGGLERVYADLEAQGYDVQAGIIPAAAVGAAHRRDRVWIVAHDAASAELPDAGSGRCHDDGLGKGGTEGAPQHQSLAPGEFRAHPERLLGERTSAGEGWARAHPSGERGHRGIEPRRGRSGSPDSGAVADTECLGSVKRLNADVFGRWRPSPEQTGVGSDGAPLDDSKGAGCGLRNTLDIGQTSGDEHAPGHAGGLDRGFAPYGASQHGQEQHEWPHESREQAPCRRDDLRPGLSGGRTTLCGVGDAPHGISRQLDGRSAAYYAPWWEGQPLAAFGPNWEHGIPRVTVGEQQRVAKLKALGNAIVPQVAYVLLCAILESDDMRGRA